MQRDIVQVISNGATTISNTATRRNNDTCNEVSLTSTATRCYAIALPESVFSPVLNYEIEVFALLLS